ncbi:MAG: GlsB/YeaQ/YmgE family stress response membrane protein [Kineosporiaceae bacterium]
MTVEGILTAIIVGAIIGALGRLILPGKQPIGWLLTIVVGIVAAILGTFLAGALGIDTDGFSFLELVVQVVLAVIGVAIVAGAFRGRSNRSVTR